MEKVKFLKLTDDGGQSYLLNPSKIAFAVIVDEERCMAKMLTGDEFMFVGEYATTLRKSLGDLAEPVHMTSIDLTKPRR